MQTVDKTTLAYQQTLCEIAGLIALKYDKDHEKIVKYYEHSDNGWFSMHDLAIKWAEEYEQTATEEDKNDNFYESVSYFVEQKIADLEV